MLMTFEEVIAEIDVNHGELSAWIEYNWILPVKKDGRYYFDETDVARARLIAELHRDLEVNEAAMPVVLRLLDQVYDLRRALSSLNRAVKTLPEEALAQLRAELERIAGENDTPGEDPSV